MSESLAFVAKANALLDQLAESNRFEPENILVLEDFRAQMSERGFSSPLSAIIQQTKEEVEREAEDAQDVKKQMRDIKYIASLKKFTFNRVRVALAAHKIAEGMLQRKDPALEYLPLGGQYVAAMSKAGNVAVFAYNELMDEFTRGRRTFDQSIAVVSYKDEKGAKKTVEFKVPASENVERKVRYIYGKSARIVSVKLSKADPPLIKSKASRIALLTAFSTISSLEVKKSMLSEEKVNAKLHEYNCILRSAGVVADSQLESFIEEEQFAPLVKKLEQKGFVIKAEDGEPELSHGLGDEVYKRQARMRSEMLGKTSERLLLPIFKFYFTTNGAEREGSNLYPTLAAFPTEKQLDILNLLSHGALRGISSVSHIVAQKMEAEAMASGIPAPAFGVAFFSFETGRDAKWCSQFFGVPEHDVKDAISKLKAIRTGRGAEFLKKAREK